jgi:hypothetical protein
VSRQSLFRRVTRYLPTTGVDPTEDRLTEITAGVLERVEGLARHLVLHWIDPARAATSECASVGTATDCAAVAALPPHAAVAVRTQVRCGESRIVDLELRFFERDRTSATAAVVWVEVKHGTSPHTRQLHDYTRLRPVLPGGVVLLAPRGDLPAPVDECPETVPQRSWQATARAASALDPGSEVGRWLIAEWLTYLREERLMDLEALGPEHLTALAYGGEARAAMAVVTEEASRVIKAARGEPGEHWKRNTGNAKPRYGIGYWESWAAPAAEGAGDPWDGAWFDWMLDESHGGELGIPAGRVFIMAGLSKERGEEFTSPDARWLEGLVDGLPRGHERLVFRRWRGNCERLQRVAYPHDVLRGETLEEQGASLGQWVVETFSAIDEHGPPIGGADR